MRFFEICGMGMLVIVVVGALLTLIWQTVNILGWKFGMRIMNKFDNRYDKK